MSCRAAPCTPLLQSRAFLRPRCTAADRRRSAVA
jgi:hypothetical protein